MKPDYRTFARAVGVSLLGAGLQLVLGVVLLVYATLGRDHTALSGSYLILAGVAVWVTIAIVFDQHRRERLEAMEAEALDATGGRGSVFDSAADELRVQARRLAWMHRFFVPAVALALGVGLILIAYWRYSSGLSLIGFDKAGKDNFAEVRPLFRGWAIALAISFSVLGFVFARFVSGMAKQQVWANLRGGAAYAVAAAIVGLVMLVGHFVDLAGSDVVLRYAQVALPVAIGLLGAEIFLTFLLNLYRPRKPGELPRAAFDSPILSFVASPDRIAKSIGDAISYQFGIDVTGSWAYRLLSRSVLSLAVFGGVVVWVLTTISVVSANEQGLRIRNGVLVEKIGPGLYFKLPWPFEVIERQDTGIAGFEDGIPGIDLATAAPGNEVKAILWTNDHKVEEFPFIVQASRMGMASQAKGEGKGDLTRGLAVVIVEVPLVYRIKDLALWDRFAAPAAREDLVRAVARREIFQYLATLTEDQLLGSKRAEAGAVLHKRIDAALNDPSKGLNAGVEVLYTSVEGVHPPKDAALKYEEVIGSYSQREELIAQGKTAAIETLAKAAGKVELAREIAAEIDKLLTSGALGSVEAIAQEQRIELLITQAGGEAAQLLSEARGSRWARAMQERGRAEAYGGRLAAYRANPKLYKANLYFDSLLELMKDNRVYLVSDDATGGKINVDLKDLDTAGNVFLSPGGEQGSGQ